MEFIFLGTVSDQLDSFDLHLSVYLSSYFISIYKKCFCLIYQILKCNVINQIFFINPIFIGIRSLTDCICLFSMTLLLITKSSPEDHRDDKKEDQSTQMNSRAEKRSVSV